MDTPQSEIHREMVEYLGKRVIGEVGGARGVHGCRYSAIAANQQDGQWTRCNLRYIERWFLFLTEETQSHRSLWTRELGQAPSCYHGWLMCLPAPICALNLLQITSTHPWASRNQMSISTSLNSKRCGLFGQLRSWGRGSKMAHWERAVSGCFNFHSNSTNSTSYESWHIQLNFEILVRSLRHEVWPQEVTEVVKI